MRAIEIPEAVLAALSGADCAGNRLVLAGQMDRALYAKVAKVIEAAGGKWDGRAKAHVFEGDAADAIEPILLTGTYSRTKQDFGQFDTPTVLAEDIVHLAAINRGMRVLEPSAGIGRLAMPAARVASVMCYEIDGKRCEALVKASAAAGPTRRLDMVVQRNFLDVDPAPVFDRVVMNPPFARRADVDHVRHALGFLKPCGRLVAIMSASIVFRRDRKTLAFYGLLAEAGGTIEALPAGSFRESGTEVNAVVVSIPAKAKAEAR